MAIQRLRNALGGPGQRMRRAGLRVLRRSVRLVLTTPVLLGTARILLRPFARFRKVLRRMVDQAVTQGLGATGPELPLGVRAIHAQVRRTATFATKPAAPRRSSRPTLAFVSPLAPVQSGVADYSADLLPELTRHYEIDVIVDQPAVTDPWVLANLPIRSVEWFRGHAHHFDHVLYQVGNSPAHHHMFALLEEIPGLVVLHDVYLGHAFASMPTQPDKATPLIKALYESHGYPALMDLRRTGLDSTVWAYPANRQAAELATGILVHSDHARDLLHAEFGRAVSEAVRVVPMPRSRPAASDRAEARARLGIAQDAFLVCSFGHLGSHKLIDRLAAAWRASAAGKDPANLLALVGPDVNGWFQRSGLPETSADGDYPPLRLTGFVSPATYGDYLAAADVAVQLRTRSRGETSATIVNCLSSGVPLIANAHGSAAELPRAVHWQIPDLFQDEDLAAAIDALWRVPARRAELRRSSLEFAGRSYNTRNAADAYREALEQVARDPRQRALRQAIADAAVTITAQPGLGPRQRIAMSQAIATQHAPPGPKQLLVDVTGIARNDGRTGIQRVVRGILRALLEHPPQGFRVEPVRMEAGAFRYATAYTLRELGIGGAGPPETLVALQAGDVFLGLDWVMANATRHAPVLEQMRAQGVRIAFVVYDLYPIKRPEVFLPETSGTFAQWMDALVRTSDVLLGISETAAADLRVWVAAHSPPGGAPPAVAAFPLGSDIAATWPTRGVPRDAAKRFRTLSGRPTLLMVGTVEPRKAYAQALGALDLLWQRGVDVNWVIVGREGWLAKDVARRLRRHRERGKRLHWLRDVSDEYLAEIYQHATVLLMPSVAEGFGIPVVEAAHHGLPIVARDIPVFREIAGPHAHYFSGTEPEQLADAIESWLALHAAGKAPQSSGMPVRTWEDCARELCRVLLGELAADGSATLNAAD